MEKLFEGQVFERNLSFHEAGKIMGTSNVKLLELLRRNDILFKEGNRNLPYDIYLRKKWFEVISVEVKNKGFEGQVPIVRITKKGFEEIAKLLIENNEFINSHNQHTFWATIKYEIEKRLTNLGLKINNLNDWLKMNVVTYNPKGSSTYTLFTFIGESKVDLITYDLKNKTIQK